MYLEIQCPLCWAQLRHHGLHRQLIRMLRLARWQRVPEQSRERSWRSIMAAAVDARKCRCGSMRRLLVTFMWTSWLCRAIRNSLCLRMHAVGR